MNNSSKISLKEWLVKTVLEYNNNHKILNLPSRFVNIWCSRLEPLILDWISEEFIEVDYFTGTDKVLRCALMKGWQIRHFLENLYTERELAMKGTINSLFFGYERFHQILKNKEKIVWEEIPSMWIDLMRRRNRGISYCCHPQEQQWTKNLLEEIEGMEIPKIKSSSKN